MKVVKRIPIKKKPLESFEEIKPKARRGGNAIMIISIIVIVALLVAIFYADRITPLFSRDEVVARVNGNAIYLSELEEQYAQVPPLYRQLFTKKVILDQIISQEVLVEEAQKMNIEIPESEMNQIIDEAIDQSGKTRAEFIQILENQNTTLDKLKEFYRLSLVIDKLITQEVISKIEISEEEIADYYEQNKELYFDNQTRVRASHILISFDNRTKEEALAIAEEVRQRALDGEEFSELAMEYSEDPSVSVNLGDLGFFPRGRMVEPFEDAAFNLSVGEISEPVETSFGYHIIYKTGEEQPGYLSLEDVADDISTVLLDTKQKEAVENYIAALREQATIEYFGEFLEENNTMELKIGNQTVEVEILTEEEVEELQQEQEALDTGEEMEEMMNESEEQVEDVEEDMDVTEEITEEMNETEEESMEEFNDTETNESAA